MCTLWGGHAKASSLCVAYPLPPGRQLFPVVWNKESFSLIPMPSFFYAPVFSFYNPPYGACSFLLPCSHFLSLLNPHNHILHTFFISNTEACTNTRCLPIQRVFVKPSTNCSCVEQC